MIVYYKLDENKNVLPCSIEELEDFFSPNKIVKQEDVGDKWVSTVFLMMDHNYGFREDISDCEPF